jgi:uncharacterized protein (TIGR03066 family)
MIAAALCVVGLAVGVAADEKKDSNKEKIIGTWEYMTPLGYPQSYAFGKEGKFKYTSKFIDGTEDSVEGTYSVEGDKVKFEVKFFGGGPITWTIKKITDTEMAVLNQGKTFELKRKK